MRQQGGTTCTGVTSISQFGRRRCDIAASIELVSFLEEEAYLFTVLNNSVF